jgi:hypothetical protein
VTIRTGLAKLRSEAEGFVLRTASLDIKAHSLNPRGQKRIIGSFYLVVKPAGLAQWSIKLVA